MRRWFTTETVDTRRLISMQFQWNSFTCDCSFFRTNFDAIRNVYNLKLRFIASWCEKKAGIWRELQWKSSFFLDTNLLRLKQTQRIEWFLSLFICLALDWLCYGVWQFAVYSFDEHMCGYLIGCVHVVNNRNVENSWNSLWMVQRLHFELYSWFFNEERAGFGFEIHLKSIRI